MEDVFDNVSEITSRLSSMHSTTDLAVFTDGDLKMYMRLTAVMRQEADRVLACGSAEINQRSRRELGGAGLAKTEGYVNSQTLIAALTGTTKADARKLDHLGKSLMHASVSVAGVDLGADPHESDRSDCDQPDCDRPDCDHSDGDHSDRDREGADSLPRLGLLVRPWFAAITDQMRSGEISPDRFEALRNGLGDSDDAVTAEALAAAAKRLLDCLHPEDAPELVYRDARNARAFLDRAGVAEMETQLLAKQEAKIFTDRDGMVHLRASFAPEDGAWVKNTLDLILGPKIGGPRLAAGKTASLAKEIEKDPRTTEQIRASVLVSLLRAGTLTDENALLAQKRPAVQIVVTASELTRPNNDGVAFIEGTGIAVTMSTVARLVCESGYVPMSVSNTGSPLDVGRESRLFTPKQRLAITALQGGCVAPGCDAPPSFCEVHHINHWCEGGETNVQEGVLLCRFHHLRLHNHAHRIIRMPDQRYEDSYFWVPPANPASPQKPTKLRFRGVAHHNGHAPRDADAGRARC